MFKEQRKGVGVWAIGGRQRQDRQGHGVSVTGGRQSFARLEVIEPHGQFEFSRRYGRGRNGQHHFVDKVLPRFQQARRQEARAGIHVPLGDRTAEHRVIQMDKDTPVTIHRPQYFPL